MEHTFEKKFGALLSVISNTSLIILKIVSGVICGSVSIVSEALHSLCDLIASFIAFISIQNSSKPPDEDHAFGHGKFEDLAGFVEALLIIITAIYIIYTGIEKILTHKFEEINTTLGIVVMLISIVVNFFVSKYLYKIAKKTDSIALYTDAQHLSADIYSSVAVLLGLFAVKITGFYYIDPIFAVVVGILIFKTGITLTRESMNNLLDGSLPKEEIEKIYRITEGRSEFMGVKIKSLKTSKSGANKNIQMEVELEPNLTLEEAHEVCNSLENQISSVILNTKIIIHPEPYS